MLNVNLNGLTFSKDDFDVTASLRDLLATGRQVSLEAFRGSRRIDSLVGNFFSVASLEEDKSDDKKEEGVKEEKKEEKEGEKKSIIKHIRDFIVKMYEKIKAFFGKIFGWFKRESAKADKNIEDIENLNANAGKPKEVGKDGPVKPVSGKPQKVDLIKSGDSVGDKVKGGGGIRPNRMQQMLKDKGKWISDDEDPNLVAQFPKTGLVSMTIGGVSNENVQSMLSGDDVEIALSDDYLDGKSSGVFKAVSSMVYTMESLTRLTNDMVRRKYGDGMSDGLPKLVSEVNEAVTGTSTPSDKGETVDIFGRSFNFSVKDDGGKTLQVINTKKDDKATMNGNVNLYVPNLKGVRALAGLHKDLSEFMVNRKVSQLVSKFDGTGPAEHLRNTAKLYSTTTSMTTMYNTSLVKMMSTLGKMTNAFIKAFKTKYPLAGNKLKGPSE